MPKATSKNGTARPNEKTLSSNAPCPTVVDADASNKIEPRIGPTQGVQPNANVAPKINELNGCPGVKNLPTDIRFSLSRNLKRGNLKSPTMYSPKKITIIPPI